MTTSYFDSAASTWDNEPRRVALARAVGEAILREAKPRNDMKLLEYGCGTGLLSLYLLPHVHSIVGADSSPGMLEILQKKLSDGRIPHLTTMRLDLERDDVPEQRFHLIVTSMTLHHVADVAKVLKAFHAMLPPGGLVCIADLDTEPGLFHTEEVAKGVHHHGFDRPGLRLLLSELGFCDIADITAHTIDKPVEGGQERAFPVFLMTGTRP